MSKMNSRRQAAFALMRWLATKDFPQQLIPDGLDHAFVQDIVYTAIRRLRTLRAVLGGYVKRWPKGELESLLYIGAAQLLFMDEVPDFAAVNETVEAAKACGNPAIAKVVNGVLRNLVRNRESVEARLAAMPLEERESFPTALVRRWTERFGAESTAALCRFCNEPAETWLARRDGSFTVLERGVRVPEVAGYAEGEFIVQDPATALAVGLVAAQPGEFILDACAAPGGKTVQLAWRGAAVTACEVNPRRRTRLVENLSRLRLADSVTVLSEIPDLRAAAFSAVLVDAPCSNTGVLRRRPDARWNWSPEKLTELGKLQSEILDRCAALVADGGRLVYSTCSIEPEENEEQVQSFLARHPEFKLEQSESSLPFATGHDGAFAARLRKGLKVPAPV